MVKSAIFNNEVVRMEDYRLEKYIDFREDE